MVFHIRQECVETLFLTDMSTTCVQKQHSYYNLCPEESIVMGWSIHKLKKSRRAFVVTNETIRFGTISNKYKIPEKIDVSDIIAVKFDGIFCMNFFLRSNQPNALSIPASYFFYGVKYGQLNDEQKTFLFYVVSILEVIVKCYK